MKILVFSDSHSGLSFMRRCMDRFRPQAVIHLGDYYDDAEALQEEHRQIPFHIVPGNCDRYRCPIGAKEMLCYPVGGVRLFMTHGHNHHVKSGIGALLADARRNQAKAALYGHTHQADCHQEDGLWVLNPGACGSSGGSVGLIEAENGEIQTVRILKAQDLEEML